MKSRDTDPDDSFFNDANFEVVEEKQIGVKELYSSVPNDKVMIASLNKPKCQTSLAERIDKPLETSPQ